MSESITEPRYSREGAAAFIGVSVRTLDRWRTQGRIDYLRVGGQVFFTESQLIDYLDSCRRDATWEQPELPLDIPTPRKRRAS